MTPITSLEEIEKVQTLLSDSMNFPQFHLGIQMLTSMYPKDIVEVLHGLEVNPSVKTYICCGVLYMDGLFCRWQIMRRFDENYTPESDEGLWKDADFEARVSNQKVKPFPYHVGTEDFLMVWVGIPWITTHPQCIWDLKKSPFPKLIEYGTTTNP